MLNNIEKIIIIIKKKKGLQCSEKEMYLQVFPHAKLENRRN
jgi:hypothetical protein